MTNTDPALLPEFTNVVLLAPLDIALSGVALGSTLKSECERLRRDAGWMATYIMGRMPDQNTMSAAEIAAYEEELHEIVERVADGIGKHRDHTLPAGATGTIVSAFPLTGTYTVEFHAPIHCVIPAVPALAVAAGTIDEKVAALMAAYDRERGRAFLLETAIEMYLADGHPRERAEGMAHDLLQSEVVDLFGGREMIVTDDTTDAELSAFMRGKRVRAQRR